VSARVGSATDIDRFPDPAIGLGAWRAADWRFTLPDPQLGPVWLVQERPREAEALRAIGVEVVSAPDDAAIAFVDGSRCDFDEIERALRPGTLVRIAVVRSQQSRHWGIADKLERQGWQVHSRIWAVGGINAAAAYIDVSDSRALAYWTRIARPKGTRARLSVFVRRMLARLGWSGALCREGFVFVRTPP
jgi:hypothetical protein